MKAILRLFVALPANWVIGQNGVARVPLPYFLQLCENHRRCLIDACFWTDLLYNDTPLLLCLAILYTKVVPILSSLLLVHQHHLHRSLVTSPDVLVLRVALYNIMIWPVILSRIMGISRGHDGFYDLVTHHINSPNLLMYMSIEALGRISLQDRGGHSCLP